MAVGALTGMAGRVGDAASTRSVDIADAIREQVDADWARWDEKVVALGKA